MATTDDPLGRARLLPAFVEIMLATGQIEEARKASDELSRAASIYDGPALRAMSDHAAGSVALAANEVARGMPLLQPAFRLWQELDAPYLAARIRAEIAAACERLGDAEGAHFERTAARKVFRRLHARPDLERLDAVESANRRAQPLTSRELEILQLAAAGHTNRTIASELSLSVRTVDRHVSNILTKFDVSSRAAAVAHAYQIKLFDG
jgi:ATP/maltotriose-dependent transcriptional regulator MalT